MCIVRPVNDSHKPQPRANVTFRLSTTAIDWLDTLRTATVTRTDVVKACLAVAKRHETEVKAAIEAMSQ